MTGLKGRRAAEAFIARSLNSSRGLPVPLKGVTEQRLAYPSSGGRCAFSLYAGLPSEHKISKGAR